MTRTTGRQPWRSEYTQVRHLAIFALFFLATGIAAAQTGGLRVEVFDEGGKLPGAIVTLSSDKGYVKTISMPTDRDGVVEFQILRAGTGYTIEVSYPGRGKIRKDGIRIPINRTVVQSIRLTSELKEVVEVLAKRDVVDLEKVETSSRFSDEFIQDLPVPGRFYQNILTMAPGVQDADGDGNPNVHGSRSRDFKAIVSGVSNVDPLTGQQLNQINPNSIEEMEVITAGAGVEYGRAQGGFANIIQKQGSNEFEGLAEMIYRSDKLDGDAASSTTGSGTRKTPYIWWQPAVQFSGPIIKDKLWYRLSHEYISREDPVDVTSSVELVTTKWSINSDQLTWQASPRTKLAYQYQNDPLEINNLGVSSIRPPESAMNFEFGGDIHSLTWTAPYSPKFLVDTTIAYQDTRRKLGPTQSGVENNCFPNNPADPNDSLAGAMCMDFVNVRYSGSWNRIDQDNRQRFTMKSTANLYGGRFWGMNHRFKFGLSVENERYFRDLTINPFLYKVWQETVWMRPRSAPEEQPDPGGGVVDDGGMVEEEEEEEERVSLTNQVLSARVAIPSRTETSATGTNWAFFVEDQIKPAQNLTMTIGLRLDQESLDAQGRSLQDPESDFIAYEAGLALIESGAYVATGEERLALIIANFTARGDVSDFYHEVGRAIEFLTIGCSGLCTSSFHLQKQQLPSDMALRNNNISPFFSLAWDPWSDGKTKISMAAGRHYNNTMLAIPMLELEPVTADVLLNCHGFNCRPGGASIVPNISEVSRDLRTPYQDEFVVAFERELFAETLGRVTYVNRKYRDQFQDIDLNHVPGDYYINDLCRIRANETALGSDGILDDCSGEMYVIQEATGGVDRFPDLGHRSDGIADLYFQNPFWGEVYMVGNFNRSDYEAYVLELVRRRYRGWELQGSYTWSMSTGDGEDFAQLIGDDRTLMDDEFGFQSQDQRHVAKLNATTITPWGFRLGTIITWQSGTPYSILDQRGSIDGVPPPLGRLGFPATRPRITYPTGVRNSGRNSSWWNVDAKFTREMNMAHGMNLQISAEVFNLLDERVYQVYNPGLEAGRQINGLNEATVTRGRMFQIGGKLSF